MHIEQHGNGKRLFLGIHGWAGSGRVFRRLEQRAPDDVTFYSLDLPGYGQSPAPTTWDLETISACVADVVHDLAKRGPLTLVGYCGGGNIGMMAAQKSPGDVSRLVLLDPFAYMPWYFRIFTWGEFGRRAYYSTFAGARGRKLTNAALKGKRVGETDLTRAFESVDHELALRAIRSFARFPTYDTFAPLQLEVDIIYGEKSFKAIKHSAELWKSIWPHARVFRLEAAGHSPIQEAPDAIARILFEGESVDSDDPGGTVRADRGAQDA